MNIGYIVLGLWIFTVLALGIGTWVTINTFIEVFRVVVDDFVRVEQKGLIDYPRNNYQRRSNSRRSDLKQRKSK